MDKPAQQVTLVSFSAETHRDALREALSIQGFECCLVEPDSWMETKAEYLRQPTVLLLSENDYPCDRVSTVLKVLKQTPVLGVFTCGDAHWNEDLLSLCTDFLGWPCHDDELSLRLQRVFGSLGVDPSAVDEAVLLEEFVGFNMLGESPAFVEALKLIKKFARCEAPVLIEGETGTGKELASRAIHYLSARRDYPFIPVNCGAIPDNLIENELFGHEKGAFTDAKESQLGIVAQARGGTLFLDEADTLSPKAQIALLRFLEHQEYRPLGSKRISKTDVRIITATNASLDRLAAKGLFRQDLLFRLHVLFLQLPPLRERGADIELLAENFTRQYSAQYKQPLKSLHPDTLEWMTRWPWSGNVRELENLLHREFLLADGPVIRVPENNVEGHDPNIRTDNRRAFSHDVGFKEAKANTVAAFERSYLFWLMAETGGNISLAARRAGKERSALRKLLQKHGIKKSVWSAGG